MSIFVKAKKLSRIALHPKNIFCEAKYLFLLSHMRSRSSVLAHILGSNPDICGYRELQFSYRSRLSLMKMRAVIYSDLECPLNNKFLLDKFLHNYSISSRVIESAKPKFIFLLRYPESTIKSIINMGHETGIEWYKDPIQAMDYYCSRLSGLEEFSKQI